jgi:hypothetical protein
LNNQKQENENIIDQLTDSEKTNEKLEGEINRMLNVKGHVMKNIDEIVKNLDNNTHPRNIRQDLINIFQFILGNSEDKQNLGKPNNLNFFGENSQILDEERDIKNNKLKSANSNLSNRSSYITQNYEKFKQSQEATKKNNENKLINQGKMLIYKNSLLQFSK